MAFQPMNDPTALLSMEDAEAIYDHAQSPRDRLLIRLLTRTGARITEILTLRRDRINWRNGTVLLKQLKKSSDVWRVVPLDQRTLRMMAEHLDTHRDSYVFEGHGKEGHLTSRQARNIVRHAAEAAGITEIGDKHISKYRHPHPHHFRHYFIAHAVAKLGDSFESLRTVQVLVGHADINTTAAYRNISTSDLQKAYKQIWDD